MPLPPELGLSQTSLSDYLACPRRFLLRHVAREPWPAAEAEPAADRERRRELGIRFHRMVRGHLAGAPEEGLARMASEDPLLRRWWERYRAHPIPDLPADRRPEASLSIPFGGRRLLATFDLLAVGPDRAVIVDWKTEARRPSGEELLGRVQTRVYRFLMAEAGEAVTGSPLAPEGVLMVYWFAEAPERPERLPYRASRRLEDEAFLTDLVRRVESDDAYPMTGDSSRCRSCGYRSLCDRGGRPEGEWDEGAGEEVEGGEDPEEESDRAGG